MENLVRVMADNWWVPLLRGIAALLFGLLALIWPGLTVYALLLVFGAYAIFDGVLSIILVINSRLSFSFKTFSMALITNVVTNIKYLFL